jgi:uncharacterized cupredoxin-like copper-binding protein
MTAPTTPSRLSRRGLLAAAGAVVLLAAASTVTVAAATGAFDSHRAYYGAFDSHRAYYGARGPSCAAPALPGTTVSVRLVDMRAMMTGGGMMGGYRGMMGQRDWRYFHRGMMRVLTSATSAPAGIVSFKVTNSGYLRHELVVLPLPPGQAPGTRAVTADGQVDESGSLGEASATCAAGEGQGIAAGSTGWLSLHLPVGRYELLCNLPGHYAAGMYAELDVT